MSKAWIHSITWGLTLFVLTLGANVTWAERTVSPLPAISMEVGQEKPEPQAMAAPYAFKATPWTGPMAWLRAARAISRIRWASSRRC